jgi:AraC-like DNA-binding protein
MAADPRSAQLVHLGRLRMPGLTVFQAHAHTCHELIIPLRGRLRADLGRRQVEAGPGGLLWYAQGTRHREQVAGPRWCDWHYLLIAWDGGHDWPAAFTDRDGRVRQLGAMIAGSAADTSAAADSMRQALAAAIIAVLSGLSANARGPSPDGLVDEMGRWMRRHLAEPITLTRMAHAAGLSRAHFARTWRARTGTTAMAALRDARLAAAQEMLMTTDLPLREVAPSVGISSEYLLSRWLTRRYGLGARALRRGQRRIGSAGIH